MWNIDIVFVFVFVVHKFIFSITDSLVFAACGTLNGILELPFFLMPIQHDSKYYELALLFSSNY